MFHCPFVRLDQDLKHGGQGLSMVMMFCISRNMPSAKPNGNELQVGGLEGRQELFNQF
jgi:hypothetical protein